MDIGMVIEKFGIPAASAISGWVGRAVTIAKKIETIEKAISDINTRIVSDITAVNKRIEETEKHIAALEERTDEQDKYISSLENRAETYASRKELERAIREIRQQVQRIESRFQDISQSFAKDSELTKFIQEEGDRWQRFVRTLGQIEGTLLHLKKGMNE